MTKADVITAMGAYSSKVHSGPISNPWKVEAFSRGDDSYEVLYYLVTPHRLFGPIHESQATSIVLKNGILVAWGQNAEAFVK